MLRLARLLTGTLLPDELAESDLLKLALNAQRHGTAAMFYWRLNRAGLGRLALGSGSVQRAHLKQAHNYLERKDAFAKIHAALETANIPAIWLKGFALAHSVYPNPALRSMRDLDVLVPHAHKETALALMQELGYAWDLPAHTQATQDMWHHFHLRGRVALELHYGLIGLRSKILPAHALTWFWTQTRPLECDGIQFTAFMPEAELLYLCAHAILQHGETEFLLHRYLDLHLLIEKNPSLDWNLILERAAELHWTYAVQRALEITHAYFGTILPENLLNELQTRARGENDQHIGLFVAPDATRLEATQSFMRAMTFAEKWKWFWSSLFPTPAYMRWRYKIRAGRQVPFFYFYRWFVILRDVLQTMLKWVCHKLVCMEQ